MGQRNMFCSHQMRDLDVDQVQSHHLHSEPSNVINSVADCPNASVHPALLSRGPAPGLDLRHFPDHNESSMVYGNQYNSLQQSSVMHLELGGSTAPPNFSYNPYLIPPSSSNVCPFPLNHGSSEHLPPSGNHRIFGVSLDEFGRNSHFIDSGRGSCKRKNAEGILGSTQRFVDTSAGSSSSSSSMTSASFSAPMNIGLQQWDKPFETGASIVEPAASYNVSDYRGSGNFSTSEDESHRSVRSRSTGINLQVDLGLAHHHSQVLQGNYMGRSFQPPNNLWVEHYGSNTGDNGNSCWNYAHPLPYMPGRSVNGGLLDIANINGQGYQDATPNINSGLIIPPPLMHYPHQHHSPVHNIRGGNHSLGYLSQVVAPHRHPASNLHYGSFNPSRDFVESVSRYPRTAAFNGDRNYRFNRRILQATQGDVNARLRHLSSEDVAVLDYSGYYGLGSFDQHRDMRLDIDDMSYEELLALEERIGDVSTGLSEELIVMCLKTRLHTTCSNSITSNHPEGMEQKDESCIICQVEYKVNEKIGMLDCGHDYHADCIRQWLLLKNVCPICKTSALSPEKKEG